MAWLDWCVFLVLCCCRSHRHNVHLRHFTERYTLASSQSFRYLSHAVHRDAVRCPVSVLKFCTYPGIILGVAPFLEARPSSICFDTGGTQSEFCRSILSPGPRKLVVIQPVCCPFFVHTILGRSSVSVQPLSFPSNNVHPCLHMWADISLCWQCSDILMSRSGIDMMYGCVLFCRCLHIHLTSYVFLQELLDQVMFRSSPV